MYDFKRLVRKYGKTKPFRLIETEGGYDYSQGGIWVDGDIEWVEFEGAVAPLPEWVIKNQHAYTVEDKALYCYVSLEPNTKVKHKGIEYTVMNKEDFTDFDSGLNIYTLKRGGL